jgi:hypothetical protein
MLFSSRSEQLLLNGDTTAIVRSPVAEQVPPHGRARINAITSPLSHFLTKVGKVVMETEFGSTDRSGDAFG